MSARAGEGKYHRLKLSYTDHFSSLHQLEFKQNGCILLDLSI